MSIASSERPRFSIALQTPTYQKMINDTLQDPKRRQRFIASITSAVAVNPALQECDPKTIISCALLGESLELSPSPQLGQYYLIPFENKLKDENGKIIYLKDENGQNLNDKNGKWVAAKRKVATFVLGYKGYIQLAIRSGQYRRLDVMAIKKGELVHYNYFTGEIETTQIDDVLVRETADTVGYYAFFELLNGFRKEMYWSKEKMEQHANRYSKAYNLAAHRKIIAGEIPEKDLWKYSSFWYEDFDGMAFKTMLRQLISHWGVMSIEMRQALESDNSVINQDGTADYISGEDVPQIPAQTEDEAQKAIEGDRAEQGTISISDLLEE